MCAVAFTIGGNGRMLVLRSEVCVFNSLNVPEKQHNSIVASGSGFAKCQAIWDTGATGTCITHKVVEALGLYPIGYCKISTAGGVVDSPRYRVDVRLPNNVVITNMVVTECTLDGADVLIGMDLITMGDFAISNYGGKTVFSFRFPSTAVTDYVQLLKAQTPQRAPNEKIGPNEPCPCGSGKKYKKCHGRVRE